MPRVSVIIPVKNAQHTLGATLQSLREQTYRDFNVILVDDGSTDGSRELMEAHREGLDLVVLDHADSRGVAASLNRAIEVCDAEWIARLDADDLASADRLDAQVAFMARNPDIDLCGSDMVMFEGEIDAPLRLHELRHPRHHAGITTGMVQRNTIAHPSVLARRSFFADVGLYDPAFETAEDYELWTRGAILGKRFANLPRALTFYRLHAGQVSREKHALQVRQDLAVKRKYLGALLAGDAGPTLPLLLSPCVAFENPDDARRVVAESAPAVVRLRDRVADPAEFDRIVAESMTRLTPVATGAPEPATPVASPLVIGERAPGAAPAGPTPTRRPDATATTTAIAPPDALPNTGSAPIPPVLHFIWLGDESLRPDRLIQTWVDLHPRWEINLWTVNDLAERSWRGHAWIRHHLEHGRVGAAAHAMRWEILAEHGGICVAPDSVCLRPLDPLLQLRAFAARRHEQLHPGELCADYIGCGPAHPLMARLVESLATTAPRTAGAPGDDGSALLTRAWRAMACPDLVRLPSDAFMPRHPRQHPPRSGAAPYACEMWAGRLDLYPALRDIDPAQIVLALRAAGVTRADAVEARAA